LGPDVNRGAVVQEALHEFGIIPGDRYVEWREAALVGKTMVGTGFEEVFGHFELSVTNTVNESRVIIHGIPHVDAAERKVSLSPIRGRGKN
jgi:hypothetical protein